MNQEHLQSYLNDHLAGAAMGLELIDFLVSVREGEPPAGFFEDLRQEVEADRQTLHDLIERLGLAPGTVRQASAWTMEKLARLKFLLAGAGKGNLGQLEAMDTLAAGIDGKGALWAALTVITPAPAPLLALDLGQLQRRANEQRARLEAIRLETARAALNSWE